MRIKLITATSFLVSAHPFISAKQIENFIIQNSSWIVKNSARTHVFPNLEDLKEVIVLGKTYSNPYQTKSAFIKHYRVLAQKLISNELNQLCLQYNFSYNKLTLRNQSTRFGSCSSKNNLNFNWQCIFFPLPIFRHLLLHELVHTKIKNHSSSFWHQLTQLDPNTSQHKTWLKQFGLKSFIIKP